MTGVLKKRWGPDTQGPCEDRKKTPPVNQEDSTQEEPVLGRLHLGLPAPGWGALDVCHVSHSSAAVGTN